MSKPREFWITDPEDGFTPQVIDPDHRFTKDEPIYPTHIHVIEKSVYDELKDKHEKVMKQCFGLPTLYPALQKNYEKLGVVAYKLATALRSMGKQCINTGFYGILDIKPGECECSSCEANKALAEYGGLLK